MGKYLSFEYNALKSIPVPSVEAERVFSAAGYLKLLQFNGPVLTANITTE